MRLTRGERRSRRAHGAIIALVSVIISILVLTALGWGVHSLLGSSAVPFAAQPTVVRVIDGDTIDVRLGHQVIRVRLLGIDTPETKDPRRPVQCFGPEASRRTGQLLPAGTIVHLEADIETHDAFGRILAYVHREDGLFVNLSLLTDGFADVLTIAPNGSHAAEFRAAAAAARAEQRGLWGSCGGPGHPAGTG
ncbi:MAG: nuclease [Actinobacteria bacterium]|nr:nuclease [Actinomycetota bacterium]